MCSSIKINSQNLTYSAQCCGRHATKILQDNSTARVRGVISKGIFIETLHQQIFFISGEHFCGPLTIKLSTMIDFKSLFLLGENCTLELHQIVFDCCTVAIDRNTLIWHPSPIHFIKDKIPEAQDRCKQLAIQIIASYSSGLFFLFLKRILEITVEKPGNQASHLKEIWRRLPGHEYNHPGNLSQRLLGLIGRGSGLTPSGDDFLVGFLLTSYYLKQVSPSTALQEELQYQIVQTARDQTTTLSAALIQCAADGAADERLMNALRWLAQGDADIRRVKSDLLSYGSSSGMDSFVGMLAAILLFSATSP